MSANQLDFRAWEAFKLATELRKVERILDRLFRILGPSIFARPFLRKREAILEQFRQLGFEHVHVPPRDRYSGRDWRGDLFTINYRACIVFAGKEADPFNVKEMQERFFSSTDTD